MTARLLLVLACFSVLEIVLSLPVKEPDKPPVHKVVEGDNLIIVCNATQSSETQIFWKKNETGSEFRQNGPELKFIYISRKAAGDYVCYSQDITKTNVNATVVEVVNVDVLYPAEVTSFSLGPTNVTAGNTFSIHCKMEGNPGPVWSVMNNKTKVAMMTANSPAGIDLISWPVGCNDAGYWVCTGHNYLNHGKNSTRGGKVVVLCPPAPRLNANEFQVKSAPGQQTSLIINADGYPYPNYTWSAKGKPLPRSQVQSLESMSMLTILDVHPDDFGEYALTMSNALGTYIANYSLAPYDGVGPYPPSGLYFTGVTSYSVTLHWTSGYDMGHRQYFNFMKWEGNTFIQISDPVYDYSSNHGIDDQFSYTLYNLEPDTYYKLGIVARNGYRNPAFSKETVEFTTDYEPYDPDGHKNRRLGLIIGCSVGGGLVVFIGLLAFIVHMVFYRRMNTSYEPMKGKNVK